MSPTVHIPKLLNVLGEYVIPQSARHARKLPDSDKRFVAEEDEMAFIWHNKLTAPYLPEGFVDINTMFI